VWELDHRLPLGRDHEAGERVDLEVVALLPRGGESRWTYEDIELSSPSCSWEATVGGASVAGGRIDAMWGTARSSSESFWPPIEIDAVVQDGDPQPEAPWLVISLTNQGTGPRMQDLENWREIKLAVPGVRPGTTGTFSRVWGTLSAGPRTFDGNAEYLRRDVVGLPGGTGIGNLLTTEVSLTRYDDERVEGTFNARFLDPSVLAPEDRTPPGVGIHTFAQAEIRASGEFSILLDQSCGTAAGVRRMQQR
jgi:hypothetical protein